MSSFIGAIAIGDLVKSTLGPKGMDKILVSMGRNSGQVIFGFDNFYNLKKLHLEIVCEVISLFILCRLRLPMMVLLF